MKKCNYCGKEYPDDATKCLFDGYDLDEATAGEAVAPVGGGRKTRVKRIQPLRAGIFMGILYGLTGIVLIPIQMVKMARAHEAMDATFFRTAGVNVILLAILGFVSWIVLAVLYNLVARWTGGMKVEVVDDPPGS